MWRKKNTDEPENDVEVEKSEPEIELLRDVQVLVLKNLRQKNGPGARSGSGVVTSRKQKFVDRNSAKIRFSVASGAGLADGIVPDLASGVGLLVVVELDPNPAKPGFQRSGDVSWPWISTTCRLYISSQS